MLLYHRKHAAGEVAETIGEVAVIARDQSVVTEITVLAENGFAQKIVAERVHAEDVHDWPGADDIAEGLTHFGAIHEQPPVSPDLLRQRKTGSHQERWPVHGVKADDFLADEMDIGGPESLRFILRAADGVEIGGQRIEPD